MEQVNIFFFDTCSLHYILNITSLNDESCFVDVLGGYKVFSAENKLSRCVFES